MSVVAEFTIPPETMPGGQTLVESPGTRIELERIVPTGQSALPFFWVWGPDPEEFMERAAAEPDVADVRLLERVEGGALFRARWSPHAEIIRGFHRLNATVVESVGTDDHWRFEVRAQDRDAFVEFREIFRNLGVEITLERIYDLSELVEGEHRTLTPEQRETLLTAYVEGYFDEPRGITQAELGERFGVSRRAVSDRLRRGVRNLIADALLPDSGEH